MSQVWLITGASRGLGRSIASAALDAGHSVVATARNEAQLHDLVAQYGDRVRAVPLNVTDEEAASRAVDEAVRAFGRLDVVVNNAGYANVGSFEDLPGTDFREQIETNFFGVVYVTRAALRVMHRQRSGHIIQMSSVGARVGTPGLSAYQSAKWAVSGFTEVLAGEVAPLGIRVTSIEPGGMRTDWAGASMRVYDISPDYQETVGVMVRIREARDLAQSNPDKVAQVILRIASDPQAPTRLLLGSDAVAFAAAAEAARARADARWHDVSVSTDYDDLPPFAESALARHLTGGAKSG